MIHSNLVHTLCASVLRLLHHAVIAMQRTIRFHAGSQLMVKVTHLHYKRVHFRVVSLHAACIKPHQSTTCFICFMR